MAIKNNGPLSLSELSSEFGGQPPHSLSEYYRSSGLVPNAGINGNVPTSGTVGLSNFYGSVRAFTVLYELQGGGGGGGYGSANREPGRGTFAGSGGISRILSGFQILVSANGGAGGANNGGDRPGNGTPGQSSFYGDGGAGGGRNRAGSSAASSSYGAAGGGGGGDEPAWNDNSGRAGLGGAAGQRSTGSLLIIPGTTLSITIGARGLASGGDYQGGNGAAGYCKITFEGKIFQFTSSGTLLVS